MPVWLEVLLNLSGYAGFVALATRGAAPDGVSADERICGGGRSAPTPKLRTISS